MTTFDFAPFYRSTVGFDRLFDALDKGTRTDWPPYNIEKRSDNEYRISMAVAGFGPDEIDLTQHGNNLLVTGQRKGEPSERQMLHQGIASRNFKQTFNLADYVKVVGAKLENGLLAIDLVREVPEQLKPRRIDISSSGGAATQGDGQKQINQASERQSKAA
jgi:molecular chaperone IbpA